MSASAGETAMRILAALALGAMAYAQGTGTILGIDTDAPGWSVPGRG
jgi:hypothetical protein